MSDDADGNLIELVRLIVESSFPAEVKQLMVARAEDRLPYYRIPRFRELLDEKQQAKGDDNGR